jgi:membrane protein YdbS with pleckstrin-like domain
LVLRPGRNALISRLILLTSACLLLGVFFWRVAAALWPPGAVWLCLLHRSRRVALTGGRLIYTGGAIAQVRREILLRDILYISSMRGPAAQLAGFCRLTFHLPGKRMSVGGLPVREAERLLEQIRIAAGGEAV